MENRVRAWLEAFDEAGIPASRDQVAALIGADGRRVARDVAAAAGRELPDRDADELDRRSGEIYEGLNTDPRPLPGAARLLATLSERGIPWAVATSSRPEQVARSVGALGLDSQPTVIDGGQVERAKPAPDLFLLGTRRLGVEPEACWCVGDATWDVEAAIAAGTVPIGVTSGAVDAEALRGAGAALVVTALDELIPFVSTEDAAAGSGDVRHAAIEPGFRVVDGADEDIGPVDAVFADYLLVRAGFPPVDVHVPTGAVTSVGDGRVAIGVSADRVRDGIWDRPPMPPHDGERREGEGEDPQ